MTALFVIGGLVLVGVVFWLLTRTRVLGEAERAARAEANETADQLREANPIGQLGLAITEAEGELDSAKNAVAQADAFRKMKLRQVDALVDEVSAKKKAAVAVATQAQGMPDGEEKERYMKTAREQAIQSKEAETRLESARNDLTGIEANHRSALQRLKAAGEKVERVKSRHTQLKSDLSLAKLDRKMTEALATVRIGSTDSKIGSLDQAVEAAQRAVDTERSHAEIDRSADSSADDVLLKVAEADRAQQGDDILAGLMRAQG